MKKSISIILIAFLLCVCMVFSLTGCVSQEDINTSVNDAVSPITEDITALEEKAAALEGKLAEVNTQIAGLNTAKSTLEGNLAEVNTQIAGLNTAKSALEAEITAIKSEITAVKAKDAEQDGKVAQIAESIESISNRLTSAEATITALSAAVEAAKGQSDKNAEDIAALLERIEALEDKNEELEVIVNCLNGQHLTFVYTDNDDGTHTKSCETCGRVVVTEKHKYTYTSNDEMHFITAKCVCGDSHELDRHCVCFSCDKEIHDLDENCFCNNCKDTCHNVDPATGICQACNIFKAEASITVDGTTTYYSVIDDAINAAMEKESRVTVLLENNCTRRDLYTEIKKGDFIIDLNGYQFDSNVNYSLTMSGGNVTVRDSKGGGKIIDPFGAYGGTLTVENAHFVSDILCVTTGTVNIKGGEIHRVSINSKDAKIILSGGSFGTVSCYADYHNPAQLLAEGCCYYDADGNVVDVDAIQPEARWYDISNVTVAPIK